MEDDPDDKKLLSIGSIAMLEDVNLAMQEFEKALDECKKIMDGEKEDE